MPAFQRVAVFWLELPSGRHPAKKEYAKSIDDTKARATFASIDQLLRSTGLVPKNRMEKIGDVRGYPVVEVKAPWKGKVIGRLLCVRVQDEFYVAVCLRKKDQALDKKSIELAIRRVRESLDGGGP